MAELPIAPMGRLLKNAGAQRVSESAKIELAGVLEEMGVELAESALRLAKHAGRNTIKASDVQLAYEGF